MIRVMRTFSGPQLEAHLNAKGIKPRELAHALQTDAGTIYRYQRGESRPRSDRAAQIADFLGIDINELYEETTPIGADRIADLAGEGIHAAKLRTPRGKRGSNGSPRGEAR